MKLTSHKALRKISEEKEVKLGELTSLISIKFGDYRDFYPIACLCSAGYINCRITINGKLETDELVLASMFYAKVSGVEKVNVYNNSSPIANPNSIVFYTTAKTEIYFSEYNSK